MPTAAGAPSTAAPSTRPTRAATSTSSPAVPGRRRSRISSDGPAAMLIDRAEFAELDRLAAHRQAFWEQQRDYVAASSPLHRRAWQGVAPPVRLEDLADLPLTDKEMLRQS